MCRCVWKPMEHWRVSSFTQKFCIVRGIVPDTLLLSYRLAVKLSCLWGEIKMSESPPKKREMGKSKEWLLISLDFVLVNVAQVLRPTLTAGVSVAPWSARPFLLSRGPAESAHSSSSPCFDRQSCAQWHRHAPTPAPARPPARGSPSRCPRLARRPVIYVGKLIALASAWSNQRRLNEATPSAAPLCLIAPQH